MKSSELILGMTDHCDFTGCLWETELGKILVCEGKLNPNSDISMRLADGADLVDVDMRNIIMSILPTL